MTTAIGIAITDHIVAGRLEDQKLASKLLRFPDDPDDRRCPHRHSPQRIGRPDRQADRERWLKRCSGRLTPSASRFPASCAMAWLRTRPICRRSRVCGWPKNWARSCGARHHGAGACRQRCRRHRRRRSRHPRPVRQAYPRVDHRQRHRLRPLALCRRRVGGRPHHCHPRSQRTLLRMRRRRAISKASWAIAPCACASSTWSRKRSSPTPKGRPALPRVCGSVAPRTGRRHGLVHSPGRAGPILLHRPQCGISGVAVCAATSKPWSA